jgi:hypothetical protein
MNIDKIKKFQRILNNNTTVPKISSLNNNDDSKTDDLTSVKSANVPKDKNKYLIGGSLLIAF